ncbi:hypothetical protein PtB15_18B364 [Puccinia triticina]|nr:hypothetical protein PtB15_18B364 [Puccinia triticina]
MSNQARSSCNESGLVQLEWLARDFSDSESSLLLLLSSLLEFPLAPLVPVPTLNSF